MPFNGFFVFCFLNVKPFLHFLLSLLCVSYGQFTLLILNKMNMSTYVRLMTAQHMVAPEA